MQTRSNLQPYHQELICLSRSATPWKTVLDAAVPNTETYVMNIIYKVFRTPELQQFQDQGETSGSPADLADGYIHFSTADTLSGTVEKHFAGERDLWLLDCDAEALGEALRWEPSRNGILFPHLYRPLRLTDIISCKKLPLTLPDQKPEL